MPFFSFSINQQITLLKEYNIKLKQTYFSKDIFIWKTLNKRNQNNKIIQREKIHKLNKVSETVLFCLPPNIGLGDAVEYGYALKAINQNKIFKNIGIAFAGRYNFIFKNFFNLPNLYPYVIPFKSYKKYKSIFHFSLEIPALKHQKYLRSDIEKEIKFHFNIPLKTNCIIKKNKIKKISIFPIASSPIRTLPIYILNKIVSSLKNSFLIDVYFDKNSDISEYVLRGFEKYNANIIDCSNVEELVNSIKSIDYGIFVDSGPLHIAKLFNKRGVLIESSVSSKILLRDYKNIICIDNPFNSKYCNSPCGLTDVFNYKGNIGCYYSLKTKKTDMQKENLLTFGGRRGIKNNYINFVQQPVGCLSSLNIQTILNCIKKDLSI